MYTLHIEHPISDFDVWAAAFARFAQQRLEAGVCRERISRPSDDPRYVVVDLDFHTARQAKDFDAFLRRTVWAAPENSPALVGAPITQVFELAHDHVSEHPATQ